jgi:hypothetical protein
MENIDLQDLHVGDENINVLSAIKHYKNHLKAVDNYQKRNKDKMALKCKNYMDKIKTEQPEKYAEILQSKKDYYQNVQKAKNQAKNQAKKNQNKNL